MDKKLIILIGPPGSGKGTQAELLAKKFNLFNLRTSKLGEAKINDPELVKNDPEVAEAKRLYDQGDLFPPAWIEKIVMEKVKELASRGESIVFDGSPRTLPEAQSEMPIFTDLYGQDNIKVFYIKLSAEETLKRNSHRRICKANQHPIPNFKEFENITVCPEDGSDLIVRTLDDPEVIKERYDVFLRRTEPIIDFLKSKEYNVIEINGEQPIEKVHEDIVSQLLITN